MKNANEKVITDIIDKTADKAAKKTVIELKKTGMLKEEKTPYQKVEYLLYNYNSFKRGVENKQDRINDIKEHGLGQKSKSITSFGGSGATLEYEDIIKEQISSIQRSINSTERGIKNIDDALARIKDYRYVEIIDMWYFKNKNRDEIAEHLGIDASTVSRNKKKLINELSILLFAGEVLKDIFN